MTTNKIAKQHRYTASFTVTVVVVAHDRVEAARKARERVVLQPLATMRTAHLVKVTKVLT